MTLRTRTHIHVVAQFGLVGWFAEIYGKSVPELGPGGLGGGGEDRMLKSIPFRIFPGHTHTLTVYRASTGRDLGRLALHD